MINLIRYYNHDLYPQYSGIAIFDEQNNYSVIYNVFDQKKFKILKKENPNALIQNYHLKDEKK